jgi:hypothetical protein
VYGFVLTPEIVVVYDDSDRRSFSGTIANDLWIRNQFVEGYVDVRGAMLPPLKILSRIITGHAPPCDAVMPWPVMLSPDDNRWRFSRNAEWLAEVP